MFKSFLSSICFLYGSVIMKGYNCQPIHTWRGIWNFWLNVWMICQWNSKRSVCFLFFLWWSVIVMNCSSDLIFVFITVPILLPKFISSTSSATGVASEEKVECLWYILEYSSSLYTDIWLLFCVRDGFHVTDGRMTYFQV